MLGTDVAGNAEAEALPAAGVSSSQSSPSLSVVPFELVLKPLSTPAKAKCCETSSGLSHDSTVPSVLLCGTAAHTRPLAHGVSTQASATHMAKEPPMQAVAFPVQASVSAIPANCWFMKRAVTAFSTYCVGAVELRKNSGAAVLLMGAKSIRETARSIDTDEREGIYVDSRERIKK